MFAEQEQLQAVIDVETAPSMSSQTTVPARSRSGVQVWMEANALYIAAVAAVVVMSAAGVPAHLSQDGWLALVAGRIIAEHGIPFHDYLTVMAYARPWHDQQWLAQLVIYELYQLGGMALFTIFYVVMTGLSFAGAIAVARSLGADDRHITWMLPIGGFFYLATAVSIRTQGFAYPLFVATLWLLATAVRRPDDRRVYLVFPMLVLWANLHGSVTLGVGMAVIYGALLLVEGVRARGWGGLAHRRGLAFVIGGPLCLLITPYGLSIIAYYRATLFNPEFSKLVTEWQPVTAYMILAVPLLLLIVATVWAIGRSGVKTPAFDQLVLIVLALGAIFAVRNITWFGLAVMMLLPATITGLARRKPPAPRRTRLNVAIAWTSVTLVLVAIVVTAARPASWFERTYPTRAVSVVEGVMARAPATKVFADVRFADWLVWHDPKLAGHIAYDTSFELLTDNQLSSLAHIGVALLPGSHDILAPYSLLVLNPADRGTNRIVLAQTHAHVILRTKRVLIATKAAT